MRKAWNILVEALPNDSIIGNPDTASLIVSKKHNCGVIII